MRHPCAHPYASSRRSAVSGAALIMALLTIALVAGLAAAALGRLAVAVDSALGRHDQAQARQLARATIDWARMLLAEDARTSSVDHLRESWATLAPPTPVAEGEVAGGIHDLSGRINLNDLLTGSGDDEVAIARFGRLLEIVGVARADTAPLLAALLDWLDADDLARSPGGAEAAWYGVQPHPRRPANAPLVRVEELAQVRGYTPELIARLAPFVAALPAGGRVNVNTAPAEVLAASVPGLTLDAARVLVAERERAWFRDVADFRARLHRDDWGLEADTTQIDVRSKYFVASVRARFGVALVRLDVLLDRSENWPAIVWQTLP